MKTLTLSAYWRRRGTSPGHHQMAFPVRFNLSSYQRCLWIPPDLRAKRVAVPIRPIFIGDNGNFDNADGAPIHAGCTTNRRDIASVDL